MRAANGEIEAKRHDEQRLKREGQVAAKNVNLVVDRSLPLLLIGSSLQGAERFATLRASTSRIEPQRVHPGGGVICALAISCRWRGCFAMLFDIVVRGKRNAGGGVLAGLAVRKHFQATELWR